MLAAKIERWSWPLTAKQTATFHKLHPQHSLFAVGKSVSTYTPRRRRSSIKLVSNVRRRSCFELSQRSPLGINQGRVKRLSLVGINVTKCAFKAADSNSHRIRKMPPAAAVSHSCQFVTCERGASGLLDSKSNESLGLLPSEFFDFSDPPTLWISQPENFDAEPNEIAERISSRSQPSTPTHRLENPSDAFLEELTKKRKLSKKKRDERDFKEKELKSAAEIVNSFKVVEDEAEGIFRVEFEQSSDKIRQVLDGPNETAAGPDVGVRFDSQLDAYSVEVHSGCPLSLHVLLSSLSTLGLKLSHLHFSSRGRYIHLTLLPTEGASNLNHTQIRTGLTEALQSYHPVDAVCLSSCRLPEFCRKELAGDVDSSLSESPPKNSEAMIFWLRDLKENRSSRLTFSTKNSPMVFVTIQEEMKKMNVDIATGSLDVENGIVNGTIECRHRGGPLMDKLQGEMKNVLLNKLSDNPKQPKEARTLNNIVRLTQAISV